MARRKKAGHRKWAAKGGKVAGKHTGDIMSREKRSALMSRIKGKGTKPEQIIMAGVRSKRFKFEAHAKDLPGRPDLVFRSRRVAVFVDGDFWHGFRFPLWKHKLSAFWQKKIEDTRKRDRRNFGKLRRMGWKVLRIWEHQIERDPEACLERIVGVLRASEVGPCS